MRVVRLQASSVEEAEQLVVDVWQVLEAANIATPEMAVSDSGGSMTIELLFASPQEASLVVETQLRSTTRHETLSS